MNYNTIYYYFGLLRSALRLKRVINAIKLMVSYRLSVLGVFTTWKTSPQFISIEPINTCNLFCPECPVGMRNSEIKGVTAEMDMVNNILDELSPTLIFVILYFQGEPLMSKNFVDIVRAAHARKLLTSTSTNGQLITDVRAKALIESGLDRIVVSIDGTTQETYEAYRTGGKLERAILGVERLVKWKKELRSASPLIEIQFIVLKTNEHEMGDMRKLAKKLKADKLTFKTAQIYNFENGNRLIPDNKKYARYELRSDGKYHIKSMLRNRCNRAWKGAVVNSRGEVLPCCFDKDSSFVFGNTTCETFAESWHSEKAHSFRQAILDNRKQFEMCRNCTEK